MVSSVPQTTQAIQQARENAAVIGSRSGDSTDPRRRNRAAVEPGDVPAASLVVGVLATLRGEFPGWDFEVTAQVRCVDGKVEEGWRVRAYHPEYPAVGLTGDGLSLWRAVSRLLTARDAAEKIGQRAKITGGPSNDATQDALPLTSRGPSGIGGYAQIETPARQRLDIEA